MDAYAEPRVLDTDLDDTLEAEDVTVGADTGDTDTPDTKSRKRLRELASAAAALKGPRSDAKLKRLIPLVKELLDDGYHPIVFCRYIPTADYLAEHLSSALSKVKDLKIDAVTGTLPPEERESRVDTLSAHDGPRLLIATDCLSEGINLQDGFTAVVHYDLAWNPTRHEQREGRVDRFGQQAPTVRTVTYYGEDNGIDGIVLEVLIRRHENIKRSTGVSVPIPVDSTTVMKAIWESLLLRGKEAEQLTLDFAEATSKSLAEQVEVEWINAAEREKASRSRFRQAGLKPDTVEHALAEVRRALGGPADVETFTRTALSTAGCPGQRHRRRVHREHRHPARPRCATNSRPPRTAGCTSTARCPSRPGTACSPAPTPRSRRLSRYVLDAALDSRLDPTARPARRAGVMRTRGVNKVTTLLVVRHRLEITIPGSAHAPSPRSPRKRKFLAFTATGDTLTWLPQAEVDALLTLTPSGNVDDALARTQLGRALGRLAALTEAPRPRPVKTRRRTWCPSTRRCAAPPRPADAHPPSGSCRPPTCSASTCSCRKRVPDERTDRLPRRPHRRHRAARRGHPAGQRTAHARPDRRRLPAAAGHGGQRRHRPRLGGHARRAPHLARRPGAAARTVTPPPN